MRPEAEKFTKKRQLKKDYLDEEFEQTNKLFALAIEDLNKPQVYIPVQQINIEKKEDEYL